MKNQEYLKETYEWKDLLAIVHKLRQPDGCPWDSTQTYESMKKCVTDEAAEVVEAVDNEEFYQSEGRTRRFNASGADVCRNCAGTAGIYTG